MNGTSDDEEDHAMGDRFKDERYKNWIKASLCLQHTKEGLERFVETTTYEYYEDVEDLISCAVNCKQCSSDDILSSSAKCSNCKKLVTKIRVSCNSGKPTWNNTNLKEMMASQNNVAKLFMPSQCRNYSTPEKGDNTALLSFLSECRKAKSKIGNPGVIIAVRNSRNDVMHSGTMRMEEQHLEEIKNRCVTLLMDPKHLKYDTNCQNAIDSILKIVGNSVHIDFVKEEKNAFDEHNKHVEGELTDLKSEVESSECTLEDIEEAKQKVKEIEESQIGMIATFDWLGRDSKKLHEIKEMASDILKKAEAKSNIMEKKELLAKREINSTLKTKVSDLKQDLDKQVARNNDLEEQIKQLNRAREEENAQMKHIMSEPRTSVHDGKNNADLSDPKTSAHDENKNDGMSDPKTSVHDEYKNDGLSDPKTGVHDENKNDGMSDPKTSVHDENKNDGQSDPKTSVHDENKNDGMSDPKTSVHDENKNDGLSDPKTSVHDENKNDGLSDLKTRVHDENKNDGLSDPNTSVHDETNTAGLSDPKTSVHDENKNDDLSDPKTSVHDENKNDGLSDPRTSVHDEKKNDGMSDPKTSVHDVNKNDGLSDPKTSVHDENKNDGLSDPKTSVHDENKNDGQSDPKTSVHDENKNDGMSDPKISVHDENKNDGLSDPKTSVHDENKNDGQSDPKTSVHDENKNDGLSDPKISVHDENKNDGKSDPKTSVNDENNNDGLSDPKNSVHDENKNDGMSDPKTCVNDENKNDGMSDPKTSVHDENKNDGLSDPKTSVHDENKNDGLSDPKTSVHDENKNDGLSDPKTSVHDENKNDGMSDPKTSVHDKNKNDGLSDPKTSVHDENKNDGLSDPKTGVHDENKNDGMSDPKTSVHDENKNDCLSDPKTGVHDGNKNDGISDPKTSVHDENKNDGMSDPKTSVHDENKNDGMSDPKTSVHDENKNDGLSDPKTSVHDEHKNDGMSDPKTSVHDENKNDALSDPKTSVHDENKNDGMSDPKTSVHDEYKNDGLSDPKTGVHDENKNDGLSDPKTSVHDENKNDGLSDLKTSVHDENKNDGLSDPNTSVHDETNTAGLSDSKTSVHDENKNDDLSDPKTSVHDENKNDGMSDPNTSVHDENKNDSLSDPKTSVHDEKNNAGLSDPMISAHDDNKNAGTTVSFKISDRDTQIAYAVVDCDAVFLPRCDSMDSNAVPSPLPKKRAKSIDDDNFSICSNDDLESPSPTKEPGNLLSPDRLRQMDEQLKLKTRGAPPHPTENLQCWANDIHSKSPMRRALNFISHPESLRETKRYPYATDYSSLKRRLSMSTSGFIRRTRSSLKLLREMKTTGRRKKKDSGADDSDEELLEAGREPHKRPHTIGIKVLPAQPLSPHSPKEKEDTGSLMSFEEQAVDQRDKRSIKKGRSTSKRLDKDKKNRGDNFTVSSASQWQYPEEFIITEVYELQLLDEFIGKKISSLTKESGKKEFQFDFVLTKCLKSFRTELKTTLSVELQKSNTCNVKYRDLFANFEVTMNATCVSEKVTSEFPVTMCINAFRGFLDEFRNIVNPKKKEKHKKKQRPKNREKTKKDIIYKTKRDGIVETRVERKITVMSDDDDGCDHDAETITEESFYKYKSEQLRMRHLVVKRILESEKSYLHVIDQLCKAKNYLQSIAMQSNELHPEDITTIFYLMDEIHKIHKDFVHELDSKLKSWTDDQEVANAFKTLVVYFKVYEEYVNNYPVAVETIRKYQENEDTRHFLEEQMEVFKDDYMRLEEILLKPVQRIQTNNLVLHDLIWHTPESHADYEILKKVLELSEENLKTYNDQQATHSRKRDAPESRHLVKSGFLVEVSRDKKQTRQLRYVFLFNDLLICTQHKGGSRHKDGSFKFLWSLPVSALCIHMKGEHKFRLKESLEDLKCKTGNLKLELREEMLKADGIKDKSFSLSHKKITRNIEKLKKKVQEQEAILVEALPKLPLNLDAEAHKQRTFLFPTDYERAEWREAVESMWNRYKGQPAVQLSNHECEVLINNTSLHMQVNGIGTVLLKKDEEMLNGSLNVTIHKMQGLNEDCEVYCCIEMDSYGHFYKKATTRVCRYINDAIFDEDFELKLDGSQTLRILCYKKEPDKDDDLIIGKCALELSLSWLNSKFNEKTISMNDVSITISIRHTPASRTLERPLERTQSKLRSGVFGVRIANITKRENRRVPSIVTTCVQQVESRGLSEVHIYRVSGVASEVQNLKKIFDKNPVMASHHVEMADIHAVTGVLKLFFRELPEPLFTEQYYHSFVQTIKLHNEEAKEKCLLELLHSLPDANYYTIVYMVEHLVRVTTQSAENEMSISNLANIFGPTLLHPVVKDSNIDPLVLTVKAAQDASQLSAILYCLIKLAASGKNIRKSATVSSSSSSISITASSDL